jgi:hypothetical protein
MVEQRIQTFLHQPIPTFFFLNLIFLENSSSLQMVISQVEKWAQKKTRLGTSVLYL